MRAIDHQGPVCTQGLGWQDLSVCVCVWGGGGGGGALDYHILNIYGFKRFFSIVNNTCSYIDPWGVASFDTTGLIGKIYVLLDIAIYLIYRLWA